MRWYAKSSIPLAPRELYITLLQSHTKLSKNLSIDKMECVGDILDTFFHTEFLPIQLYELSLTHESQYAVCQNLKPWNPNAPKVSWVFQREEKSFVLRLPNTATKIDSASVSALFASEVICDPLDCEWCCAPTRNGIVTKSILSCPRVLLLQYKRFEYIGTSSRRIKTAVDISPSLSLQRTRLRGGTTSVVYDLHSIVEHHPRPPHSTSIESGHYVCRIFSHGHSVQHLCDDSTIRTLNEKQATTCLDSNTYVYICVYEQRMH